MRRITLLTLTLLTLLSSSNAAAKTGEYILEIEAGKKILNVQKLDLAPTTRLSELLEMFPELLSREGDLKLQNYDLQIENVSTGDSKLIILEQLTLSDIKDIEVSSTPSASQGKNGQGGVIKLHLNPLSEGLSGMAMLGVGSTVSVTPGLRLNYKKGPWSVRGSLMMNYYHPRDEFRSRSYEYEDYNKYQLDSSTIDNSYELAKVDVLFTPDKHNKLHLWGWENYMFNYDLAQSQVEINSRTNEESSNQKNRNFKWMVGANYSFKFSKSEIEAECTYENNPGSCNYDKYSLFRGTTVKNMDYWDKTSFSKVDGFVKYKYNFIPDTPKSKAKLTAGVNTNYSDRGTKYNLQRYLNLSLENADKDYDFTGTAAQFYLSPFIESDNIFGKWFLKASLRYQHYSSKTNILDKPLETRYENYLTGFLSAGYQLAPHHHLSLILDRSLLRGSAQQMFPYPIYDPGKDSMTEGDALLRPTFTNSVAANYITDFASGDNKFTFDLELKFMNNTDIITSYYTESRILKYTNDGHSNIGAANFLFHYSSKTFSVSFTANGFNNYSHINGDDDHYLYYNIGVVPALSFDRGWMISGQFAYNSHVYTKRTRLSDYFYANTRFSKVWDRWTLYIELNDNFHKMAKDEIYTKTSEGATVKEVDMYNLNRPSLLAGVHFKF